jgi:hypothetical protein
MSDIADIKADVDAQLCLILKVFECIKKLLKTANLNTAYSQ